LHALIGAAPLQIHATPSGVLILAAAPAAPVDGGAQVASRQPPEPSNAVSAAEDPVVVSARRKTRRAELEPKIQSFVFGIATQTAEEGLARWKTPVCPLVTGLPELEGEFMLARISEIARAAQAPLAGENCRPNLYVLVTGHPKELLEGWEKRNWMLYFGADAYPLAIDEFIDTPRPVRAWYTVPVWNASGVTGGAGYQSAGSLGGTENVAGEVSGMAQESQLLVSVDYLFSRVFVIVDEKRLQGVARGQLADYVAMVGLAQIRPEARLNDAQTILRLFTDGPKTAPAGLTAWDQAYLKALYATAESYTNPRYRLAHRIVSELVP